MSSVGPSEIVLIVEDVPAAARLYEDVVGLTLEQEPSDEWAWFWAGKEGVEQRVALHGGSLLFEEHSPYPEGEGFGRVHLAFEVAREELDVAVGRVRGARRRRGAWGPSSSRGWTHGRTTSTTLTGICSNSGPRRASGPVQRSLASAPAARTQRRTGRARAETRCFEARC